MAPKSSLKPSPKRKFRQAFEKHDGSYATVLFVLWTMPADSTLTDLETWTVVTGRIRGRWDHSRLRIKPFTDQTERFQPGAKLCVAPEEGPRQLLTIQASDAKDHDWVCDCGIQTSEAADALVGSMVYIHPSMRRALPEGEFYLDDIFGLRVKTESGKDLGEIYEILESPAHNIYVTRRAMIPAHPDFIVKTDWETKTLTVKDILGEKPEE